LSDAFIGAAPISRGPVQVPRAASSFTSGKINVGTEFSTNAEAVRFAAPVLDEEVDKAIADCLEEGCSVEALMSLDTKLAAEEQKVAASMSEVEAAQKTAYSASNDASIAWLKNFLGRTGSLRAQLKALRGITDSNFVKQMIKAATVAFGGARPNDYPKVGLSSYSN